ncbi:hypothetical protein MK489_18255 [Myxococcota bacterium]|nr:hypothetical protein [Myxococcota bacterium]
MLICSAPRVLCALVLLMLCASSTSALPAFWSISPRDNVLRRVDGATGRTHKGSQVLTVAGETEVLGGYGIARHPSTGILYVILRVPSTASRVLCTVNEEDGICTRVGPTGDTGDRFAGITFSSDGTLYALTGDGAGYYDPETLCTLSLIDASATCGLTLGNGSHGEVLAFNPDDGLIYHGSGSGTPNDPTAGEIFETVDPGTSTITPIPLSGHDYTNLTGLYYAGNGVFYAAEPNENSGDNPHILTITDAGFVELVAPLDHISKGFALLPATVPVTPFHPFATVLGGLVLIVGMRPFLGRRDGTPVPPR